MGLAVDRSEPDRRLGIRSLDSFTVPEAGPSLRYLREKEHRERAGARRVAAVDQLVRARIWSAVEAGRPTVLVRQIVSHSVDGSPAVVEFLGVESWRPGWDKNLAVAGT